MELRQLKTRFIKEFGESDEPIRFFSAAGRVNLIGEHIDYCGGFVLPAGLNLCNVIAARKRKDNFICLKATTTDKKANLDIGKLGDYKNLEWGEYQAGVAYIMQKEGYKLVGCDLLYHSTVPFGSGLSSSAAIEVSTAEVLSVFSHEAGGKASALIDLALIGQRAENEYAGVNCGIMDQFASALAKKDHAILLNCKTLEYEYVPVRLDGYQIVIANSNKKRSLQDSKYNERRAECEEALAKLKTRLKGIACLADVSVRDFETNKEVLSGKVKDRARHVVYECERVKSAVTALQAGDAETFGRLLDESHASLRDLYEVTGYELDALVRLSREAEGCVGSRMTGAGFGGCNVSLVKKECVEKFIEQVGLLYTKDVGYPAEFYITSIQDGAMEILEEK